MILIGRGLDLKEGKSRKPEEIVGKSFRSVPVQFSRCESAEGRRKANESAQAKSHTISGDNSLRDPPVPIPNTEVKPQHADGTWLETARESRSSPDSTKN